MQKTACLLLLVSLVALSGCRRDENILGGSAQATPAGLNLPSWVLDSIPEMPIPMDNQLTVQGIALGRKLFYDPLLSDDYTQSCSSCHVQANGFSDPLAFSVGTDGSVGTRNAMAVINLGWDRFFFWDGRRESLEEQAHDPVTNPIEMNNTWPTVVARLQADPEYPARFEAAFGTSTVDSMLVVKAIAQFERTLLSFGSRYDKFRFLGDSSALSASEQHGLALFERDAHCADCHGGPLFSDGLIRNNGLDQIPADSGLYLINGNPADIGAFKVPTLRNISATGPYMHDSRFNTLEEVVDFYADGVQINAVGLDAHMAPWVDGDISLDMQDRTDLVAFLRALTDSTFLYNPAFSAP